VPIIRPRNIETTAIGAAYLAGLAVGFWASREEIAGNWAVETTYHASRPEDSVKKLRRGWERALERSKGWETTA
jgi:glycerol kinase